MPDDKKQTGEPHELEAESTPDVVDELDDEIIEVMAVDEETGLPMEDAEAAPPPAVGVDDAERLRAEVDRLRGELDHMRDVYLRKLAEFDNFRKRTERERDEMQRTAGENVVRELVPVLDNFERALMHTDEGDAGSFRQGVGMIARQLWDVLERQGMECLDPLGAPFQPEFHEAVRRVEDSSAKPGTVAEVLAKGYLFGGRLIRPAMVGVVVEPAAVDGGAAEGEGAS